MCKNTHLIFDSPISANQRLYTIDYVMIGKLLKKVSKSRKEDVIMRHPLFCLLKKYCDQLFNNLGFNSTVFKTIFLCVIWN